MEQNIIEYLKCMYVDVSSLIITKIADNQYQISVKDTDENAANEKMQAIIAQVDRDEEHPVVMNGVAVFTRVVKQPEKTENPNEYAIIVSIVPVSK